MNDRKGPARLAGVVLVLLALAGLRGSQPATLEHAPELPLASASTSPAASVALTSPAGAAPREDARMSAYAEERWASWAGAVASDEGEVRAVAKAQPARTFKRLKKWKKRGKKASARQIEQRMQDAEDEADDGKEPVLTEDERRAEEIGSREALRKAIEAEDALAQDEDEDDELLGAEAPGR